MLHTHCSTTEILIACYIQRYVVSCEHFDNNAHKTNECYYSSTSTSRARDPSQNADADADADDSICQRLRPSKSPTQNSEHSYRCVQRDFCWCFLRRSFTTPVSFTATTARW